ncbi:MAG: invasion associated locus B family protein [Bauldia sp.]
MLNRIVAALVILAASATAAFPQASNRVATFQDWSVYVYSGPSGRVCYAATQPRTMAPVGVNRDPVFFMVANWPDRNAANEVSIIMGYPLEANSSVTVTIDADENFVLFTRDDAAWISDLATEAQLIVSMRRGIEMVVRGRSARGTDTTDNYSLRGISAALDRAVQECA